MSEPMLAAATRDPRIGQIVQDRYRIVRKIGEGGMGAVYEGEHTVIRRKVAIKCLHAQYATNQEMVNRFHREAMAANAIRHANIVEVTDMGRFEDGAVFMVLEFLEGRELSDVMKKEGALSLARAVHIVSQVCDALSAAHEQNIVHRDLKPDNIFLLPRSEQDPDFVKVLDFGIAKFRESGHGQGITRTGMTMGTPNYMAPEQAQASKELDHRADIYSLGVILFHCITGVLPYDDESFPMLMVKVISYPAPRLRSVAPEIPPAIDELVDRMLAKDPALRPSSCREVKAALQPFRDVHTRFAAGKAPQAMTQVGFPNLMTPSGSPATGARTRPLGPAGSDPSLVGSQPQVQGHGSQPQVPGYGSQPQVQAGSTPSIQVPRSGFPMWALAVGALVVLVGGGGAFAAAFIDWGDGNNDTPPPPVVHAPVEEPRATNDPNETSQHEEPQARAEETRPATEPAPTERVRVQITTEPADAELFLDNDPISNPFDADLPQTREPRRLEARLAGYRTHVRDLVLSNYPQRVLIPLQRGDGVDDQRRQRTAGTTPRRDPGAARTQEPQAPVVRPLERQNGTTPTGPSTPPADQGQQQQQGGQPRGREGFVPVEI